MRLLILGGTGSTGRALIDDLRQRDEPVSITVISRSARDLPAVTQVVTGHYAQVVPENPFRRELPTFDAVVHLADGLGELQSHKRARNTQLADPLIAASRDVAIAARDARMPCFIHVSSIKAICGEDDTRVLTETCTPAPTSLYGRSKLRLEQTLQQVFEGSATRLVILRNPVMYAEAKAGSIQRLLALADTPWPLPLGGLRNKRSLLAVRNLASALVAVLRAGPSAPAGVFHVHDGPPLSTTELVTVLRKALGRRVRLYSVEHATQLFCHLPVLGPVARRLYGSLEVSDANFRHTFAWSPVVETRAGLANMARHWQAAGSRPQRQLARASE